jgi:hypothetical protein
MINKICAPGQFRRITSFEEKYTRHTPTEINPFCSPPAAYSYTFRLGSQTPPRLLHIRSHAFAYTLQKPFKLGSRTSNLDERRKLLLLALVRLRT